MEKIDKLKQLRKATGISLVECKKALEAVDYDTQKAKLILRSKIDELSVKKAKRETREGVVKSYIHSNNKVGAMVEILCESDFVAKSKDFENLAHEICLQIVAQEPLFVKSEDISEEFLAKEAKVFKEQFAKLGKSQEIIDKMVENKLKKDKEEISLLSQSWIRDEKKTIKDLIQEYIAKFGENIIVGKFIRYEI